jgi:hypothetical protein
VGEPHQSFLVALWATWAAWAARSVLRPFGSVSLPGVVASEAHYLEPEALEVLGALALAGLSAGFLLELCALLAL